MTTTLQCNQQQLHSLDFVGVSSRAPKSERENESYYCETHALQNTVGRWLTKNGGIPHIVDYEITYK